MTQLQGRGPSGSKAGPDEGGERCAFCCRGQSSLGWSGALQRREADYLGGCMCQPMGPQPRQVSVQRDASGACRSYSSGRGRCQILCLQPQLGFAQEPQGLSIRKGCFVLSCVQAGGWPPGLPEATQVKGRHCAHPAGFLPYGLLRRRWQSFRLSHLHPLWCLQLRAQPAASAVVSVALTPPPWPPFLMLLLLLLLLQGCSCTSLLTGMTSRLPLEQEQNWSWNLKHRVSKWLAQGNTACK